MRCNLVLKCWHMLLQFGKHLILDTYFKKNFKIITCLDNYVYYDLKSISIVVKENITDVIHSKYSKTFPSKIREIATWHNLCYNMKRYNVFELITSRSITINRCCLSFCWKVFHTKVMVILDMSKSALISRLETWKL